MLEPSKHSQSKPLDTEQQSKDAQGQLLFDFTSKRYNANQVSQYQHLLGKLDNDWFSLKFPKHIETIYQQALSQLFKKSNLVFIKISIPIYLVFFLIDYMLYPDKFVSLSFMRFFVFGYICAFVYFAVRDKLPISIITAALVGLILCLLHVVFGSMLFASPYDVLYSAGLLSVYVYAITLLRFSFKHSLVFCLCFVLSSAICIVDSYFHYSLPSNIETIYLAVIPIMFLFMVLISSTGLFLSYSIDRLTRENWLREQILTIESVHLSQMAQSLKLLSETDGLTGLYNRRFFDKALIEKWLYGVQNQQPVSLIMLDVDWFKAYNDHYGHQQGDEILRQIAHCMNDMVNGTSYILTRYGGEEFFIILPEVERQQAVSFAEMLGSKVHQLNIEHTCSPLGVCTLSLGVGTFYPYQFDATNYEKDIATSVNAVDQALYRAKSSGKNQTVSVYQRGL